MTDQAKRWAMADGLAIFGDAVEEWHRGNWPDPEAGDVHVRGGLNVNRVLGVTKVAEEAGELVGAVTRFVEGRPGLTVEDAIDNAYAELGDVVIACAGALRRLNGLTGADRAFADVVLDRWDVIAQRDYCR